MSQTRCFLGKKMPTPLELTSKFRALNEDLRIETGPNDAWLVLKAPQTSNRKSVREMLGFGDETLLLQSDAAHDNTETAGDSLASKIGESEIVIPTRTSLEFTTPKFDPVAVPLHDLLSAPNQSLEMIRIYINCYPWALKNRDSSGRLPLHVALDRDDCSCLIICELLQKFTRSAGLRDGDGRLPLFIACSRAKMNISVIKALLQAYPEAVAETSIGALPLHVLAHSGNSCPEMIRFLLAHYPDAASIPNNFGNLPLHYLCAIDNPFTESLRLLMRVYPEAVTFRNNYGETPIDRALAKYENSEAIRERMRLLLRSARTDCLSNDQLTLLRQLNWEARRIIIIMCVQFCAGQVAPSEKGLLHMYFACDGVWRHIIAYL